jgi:hypothetical protein
VGAPFWLLFIDPDRPLDEERGVPALLETLERVDRCIDVLFAATPTARRDLAELRARTDEIAISMGRPEQVGIDPAALGDLVTCAIKEVGELFPDRRPVQFAPADPAAVDVRIAESSGLALRAIRALLRLALASASPERAVELATDVQPTVVHLDVRGAGSADLGDAGRLLSALAEAVGGSAGRRQGADRAVVRLTLPRA